MTSAMTVNPSPLQSRMIDVKEIPPVFLEILQKRGIEGSDAISRFLLPKLDDLPKPWIMAGMEDAVDLVIEYLVKEKRIIVWGDYDVDGTTGTALLVNFFKKLGKEVEWHIPNRLNEGYGLNAEWFSVQKKYFLSDFLLITVDCGISNGLVIEKIKKMGGKTIITDHHSLPKNSLPDCVILNPSQKNCGFNQEHLAGVGVAFYLAAGIRSRLLSSGNCGSDLKQLKLKDFLAFVALGTVADVVRVGLTNRILVRAGVEAIKNTSFPGIAALLDSCDIHNGEIGSEDIGFLLGPLINAAGRIGDSETVVKLLTTASAAEANILAKKLVKLNLKRKSICSNDFKQTLEKISKNLISEDKCIVVSGEIHRGIAGIVASRLVDMFRVPAIVFGTAKGENGERLLVGSARSVEGVSVVEVLDNASELLLKHGGHAMAAGATLFEDNFIEFGVKFKSFIGRLMKERPARKTNISVFACEVDEMMSEKCLSFFELLEPFGPGNELPVFFDKNADIVDSKRVGREAEHLQVAVRGKYSNYKGIGFGLGERRSEIQETPRRELHYTPTKNRYRGRTSWQIKITDL